MASSTDQLFELGRLYFERGDFALSVLNLREAAQANFEQRKFTEYLKCQNLLLRIYAEREEFEEINVTKERLQDLVLKEGFELSSRTYYTLANCATLKGQTEIALDYLQKALAIALASDHKEDICYSIFGLAAVYTSMKPPRYEEALKEIYNLQVFYQFLDLPELKISTYILNAWILQQLKKYDEAIDICWKAYEDLKKVKNQYIAIYLLYNLAAIYADMGDRDMARLYANLARRSADPENFIRLNRMLGKLFERIGGTSEAAYDLVFDEENHTVVEKKLGRIDFKNQFILLDLLKLFVQNQGTVYTKEYLVEHVWKTPYDQKVHDNKIYVTIKRLRKLIEPDYEKPKYIFRAKNGYYMNKAARVFMELGQ